MAEYDVFLSYNSADQETVEVIARRLREEAKLELFLDRWHLVPGQPWQEAVEEALDASRACAVFLGPAGLGTWENEEMRAGLDIRTSRPDYRVIPVLLPGARLPERGRLPRFLARLTWVDFRPGPDDTHAFHELVSGIKGIAPGPEGLAKAETTCPFRGLQAFDEEHALFFFGREALTQHLMEQLREDRFLAVIGPSGSGKSSLVRAGLVPQVRAGALPNSERWPVVILKPGPHPLETLAARLLPLLGGSADPLAARASLLGTLRRDERGLHAAVQVALAAAPDSQRLLLVVDQFEELFTLCRDESARTGFIVNLLYASAIAGGQTVAVVTMRADFFGKCAAYPALAARLAERDVLVGPMTPEELRRAMEHPAQAVGLHYEKGLTETILDDLGDEPGTLPLLQHTLLELWGRRRGGWLTTDAYHALGGVKGALAQRADEVYARLTPEQQAAAQRVLLRLTQPGEGTEDTRRRAALAELLPPDAKAADVETAVQALTDARLLTTGKDEQGREVVDVAHEALIRGWPRLQGWIETDRAALLTHRRLTDAAQEWERQECDESYLYRGARLAEAQEWAEAHPQTMSPSEHRFLCASQELAVSELAAAQRRAAQLRRRALYLAATLVVALAAAVTAVVFAVQIRQRARTTLARQLAAQASTRLDDAFDQALLLSLEANRLADLAETQGSLLEGMLYNPRLTFFLHGHQDSVMSLALGPDNTLASASEDGTIILWDLQTHRPVVQLEDHDSKVWSVAFTPDGRVMASGDAHGLILWWDVATYQLLERSSAHPEDTRCLAFSPDGRLLASGSYDDTIAIWDVETRQLLRRLAPDTGGVYSVAFSPDSQLLASSDANGTIHLWDVADVRQATQLAAGRLSGHEGTVFALAFSPTEEMLASGGKDGQIILWNLTTQKSFVSFTEHTNSVYALAFSANGRVLASGSRDGTIRRWSIPRRQPYDQPLDAQTAFVYSLVFSADGRTLIAAGRKGAIVVWDLSVSQRIARSVARHRADTRTVAFSADGRMLASGSHDTTIMLRDALTGEPIGEPLTGHDAPVNAVAFCPVGGWLASGSDNAEKPILLWDTTTDQTVGSPLTGHAGGVTSLAFSPDGHILASGGRDNAIALWNTANVAAGVSLMGSPLRGHGGEIMSLAFSPDGRLLASGSADGSVALWQVTDGSLMVQEWTDASWVMSVAFSPDGQTLAIGDNNSVITLWDAAHPETGLQPIGQPLQGHTDFVSGLAFSPDGRLLASSSLDHSLILWDMASRQTLGWPLAGHADKVWAVAFSPDGTQMASAGDDNVAVLWDIRFESWQERACRTANRNLTPGEWQAFIGTAVRYHPTCPDLAVEPIE